MIEKDSFTLLETIIAMAVFMFIVAGTIVMFYQGSRSSRKSRVTLIATNMVREKLEELSNKDYPSLFVTNTPCTRPLPSVCGRPFCPCQLITLVAPDEPEASVSTSPGFSLTREVDVECPYLDYDELSRIQVTVWWDIGTPHENYLTIETLKADY